MSALLDDREQLLDVRVLGARERADQLPHLLRAREPLLARQLSPAGDRGGVLALVLAEGLHAASGSCSIHSSSRLNSSNTRRGTSTSASSSRDSQSAAA